MRRSRTISGPGSGLGSGLGLLLIGGVVIGATGGCQQVLFPRKEPRTQYEQYDRMRQRNAPIQEPDVFGNPQPALRQRLSQPKA
jgi:hypothetical protein